MKMHLDNAAGTRRITGYGAGYVSIDEKQFTCSFILTPEKLITDWGPQNVAELDEAALEAVARLRPSIVLLGTGVEQCFPPSSLIAEIRSNISIGGSGSCALPSPNNSPRPHASRSS